MLEGFGGQTVATQVIRNVLRRGSVPHAYMLFGPKGVGKRRAALSLGRVLACHAPLCPDEGEPSACGTCASCRLPFAPGAHHDLVYIEPQPVASRASASEPDEEPSVDERISVAGGQVRVEQVREAERALSRSIVAGRRRVCIVPDAERLCRQAAAGNAFLKTLEEPPANTVIILTTSNMADLLPTIISRCLLLPFVPLPAHELERELAGMPTGSAASLLEDEVAPERARLAARVAAGRRDLAEVLVMNEDMAEARGMALDVLRSALRGDPLRALRGADLLADQCVTWWAGTAGVDVSEGIGAQARERVLRLAIPEVLSLLEAYLRDMLVVAAGGDAEALTNLDRTDDIMTDAAQLTASEIAQRLKTLSVTRRMVAQNTNCRLALEVALMKMRAVRRAG